MPHLDTLRFDLKFVNPTEERIAAFMQIFEGADKRRWEAYLPEVEPNGDVVFVFHGPVNIGYDGHLYDQGLTTLLTAMAHYVTGKIIFLIGSLNLVAVKLKRDKTVSLHPVRMTIQRQGVPIAP